MSESVRTLPGARWRCCSTSACCRVHQLGPVSEEVVQDLRQRGVEQDWPSAADGWVDRRPGPGGTSGWFLRHGADGACVFLRPDRLCAIHALYGEEAKPAFCREFPFALSRDPRGLSAVVRPACAGLHEAMLDGEPVQDQALGAARLPRHAPIPVFEPARVEVLPGVHLELDPWLDTEPELVALVAQAPAQPEAAVAAVRRDLARRTLSTLPVPDPARYTLAASAVLEALRMMLGHVLRQSEGAPTYQVDFVRQVHDAVVAAREAEGSAVLDEGALDYTRLLLRTELHGRRWQGSGSVHAGLGLWLAGVALVRRARADAGPVSVADFAAMHTPFVRLSAHPAVASVLRRARPALVDLFLHACTDGVAG